VQRVIGFFENDQGTFHAVVEPPMKILILMISLISLVVTGCSTDDNNYPNNKPINTDTSHPTQNTPAASMPPNSGGNPSTPP
jgi:hypothetical protein